MQVFENINKIGKIGQIKIVYFALVEGNLFDAY